MTIVPPETKTLGNLIDGEERSCAGQTLENFAPASGEVLSLLAGSRAGDEIAAVVCAETSKSPKAAKGEEDGVIEIGYFIAGEGVLPRVLEAVA